MANVNLGLDEIIQSQKKKNRGGNRGDRLVSGGGNRQNGKGAGARLSRNGGGRSEKYFSDVSDIFFGTFFVSKLEIL